MKNLKEEIYVDSTNAPLPEDVYRNIPSNIYQKMIGFFFFDEVIIIMIRKAIRDENEESQR